MRLLARTKETECRSQLAQALRALAWSGPQFWARTSWESSFSGVWRCDPPLLLRTPALQRPRHIAEVQHVDATDHGPRWTRREQVEIDGLKYDICVTVRRDEYVGVWMCRDCGEHGAAVLKNSTADQASTRAQIDLCAHHNSVHRRPRKPK